jgi:hypothetical protein
MFVVFVYKNNSMVSDLPPLPINAVFNNTFEEYTDKDDNDDDDDEDTDPNDEAAPPPIPTTDPDGKRVIVVVFVCDAHCDIVDV